MTSDRIPPDLLSLVLTLRPLGQTNPDQPPPRWWGRAAHALLLDVIQQAEPRLAASLHPGGQENTGQEQTSLRPFSVSTLMGRFHHGLPDIHQAYTLRLTAIRSDLARILLDACQGGPLAAGRHVQLDYLPFEIQAVQPDSSHPAKAEHPWAAASSYQELSAPYLLARLPAPRRVSLQFTSPVTFKSGGKHLPLPLPELVFGSLLERWNAHAPLAFPPEARRYAAECLALGRYRLSSRVVPAKGRGMRVGGVGQVTYTSLNYDRYWMSLMAVLAEFALYAGVGAGTSMGLGQCRRVQTEKDNRADSGETR